MPHPILGDGKAISKRQTADCTALGEEYGQGPRNGPGYPTDAAKRFMVRHDPTLQPLQTIKQHPHHLMPRPYNSLQDGKLFSDKFIINLPIKNIKKTISRVEGLGCKEELWFPRNTQRNQREGD